MTFEEALAKLKKDSWVCRESWNGEYLRLQTFDEKPKHTITLMTQPYIFINTSQSDGVKKVPWQASQADMLADDWQISSQALETNGGTQ